MGVGVGSLWEAEVGQRGVRASVPAGHPWRRPLRAVVVAGSRQASATHTTPTVRAAPLSLLTVRFPLRSPLLLLPFSAIFPPPPPRRSAGLLLGMTYVHEAARHPLLAAYLSRLMNAVIPRSLTTSLSILSAHAPTFCLPGYTASLASRFADAGVGDVLARVAQDGSSKYPAQLLPIVRSLPAAAALPAAADSPAQSTLLSPPCADVQALAFSVATWATSLGHRSLPVADGRREELRAALRVGAGEAADAGIWRLLGARGLFGADGRRGAPLADAAAAQYMAIQREGVAAALAAVLAAE